MNVHYSFLVSLSLVASGGLWYFFPLSLNPISPLQQLHLIATFMLSIMWLMSFSGEVQFNTQSNSPTQVQNRFTQSKIFVVAIMVTGGIIYLIN